MALELRSGGPDLSEADLVAAEQSIGRQIPDEYREFLRKHNGGRPKPSDFEFGPQHEPMDVKVFLGIKMPENTFNISYVVEALGDEMPNGFFPIARDPGGGVIGILTRETGQAPVLYWDHETNGHENNLVPIANNFGDFIKMIEEN